jgi:hypothetical protein
MAALDAKFMGAPMVHSDLHEPSDEDCLLYLSLLEETCEVAQHAVTAKTAAKKKTAMADLEQWQQRYGKTAVQSTPMDCRVYLQNWSKTHGTFNKRGQQFAAPSSVKAQASFLATELDKHPATVGLWNPHANDGKGAGKIRTILSKEIFYLVNTVFCISWSATLSRE